ncbi:MAG: outer membrane beta-barrel protein [Desulfobacterales bacterium]
MKKFILVLFVVCFSFLFASTASAVMYVAVKAGYTQADDTDAVLDEEEEGEVMMIPVDIDFDAGWLGGIAIGMIMDNNFRLEGEFEYRRSDFDIKVDGVAVEDDTLDTMAFLLNVFYDLKTGAPLTPYIGGGVGLAYHEVDDDDTVLAYHGTVGVAWAVGPTMDLDLAYRYFATDDPELGSSEVEYDSHNVTAGVRFKF